MPNYAVIGIDPGTTGGIAAVTVEAEPFLLYSSVVKQDKTGAEKEKKALKDCILSIIDNDCVIYNVLVEGQYLGKSPKTSLMLSRLCGRWCGVIDTMLTNNTAPAAVTVLPRAWQSIVADCIGRSTKSATIKYVKQTYGVTVGEHKADAICIATYGAFKALRTIGQ